MFFPDRHRYKFEVPVLILKALEFHKLWPKSGDLSKLTLRFYVTATLYFTILTVPVTCLIYHLFGPFSHSLEVTFLNFNILISYLTIEAMIVAYFCSMRTAIWLVYNAYKYLYDNKEQIKLRYYQEKAFFGALLGAPAAAVIYMTYRIIEEDSCRANSNEDDARYYCGLLYPSFLLPKSNYKLITIMISLSQLISSVLFYEAIFTLYALAMCALQQLILQIRLLRESLELVRPKESCYYYKTYIKHFVMYRINIGRMAKLVDKSTYYIHFVHITSCSVIFMLAFIDTYLNRNMFSLAHLMVWVSSIGYLAILGQWVIDESEALSFAVYNMNWYEMDIQLRQDIMLMLIATQKPIRINAGPFSTLSHATFLQILKAACSYCTMVFNLRLN